MASFFANTGKFLEIWACQNSKQLANFFVRIFLAASLASLYKVIFTILLSCFSPLTPTQGSTNHTPALESHEPLQYRDMSRVGRWCWQHRWLMGWMTRVTHLVCGTAAVLGWCSSQPQRNSRPSFPKTTYTWLLSGCKACRPLGSTTCVWIPLQVTHSSTGSVAICRLSAERGFTTSTYGVSIQSENVTWLR